MTKIAVLLLLFIFLQVTPSVAQSFTQEKEDSYFSGVLKSRKVVGVIYFKKNSHKLSKTQQAELNRIASLVVSQCSSDKIVRVEGFVTKNMRRTSPLNDSLAKARSVWHFLSKKDFFKTGNLYLTGFGSKQTISNLQGERVEIAVYENPFNGKKEVYSSN